MGRATGLVIAAVLLGALLPGSALAEKAGVVRTESFRLLNEGVAAYKRGEYVKAVDSLRRSAAMALNSFRAHYYLGLALSGDRRYEEAVEALTVALDLDPTHLQAHVARGDAFLKLGDTGEAMAEYYRAIKLRPEFPPALDGIARVHEAMADDEKAIRFFERSIASNRGYADAYTHLGDLYLRLNRIDEAVRLLAEAVSIRPDFAPGLNRLALAYGQLGLANQAVATIRKAIELQPNVAEHHATLGRIQLGLELVANAETAFMQALGLDPAHPGALEGLAEVSRRRGEYDAAFGYLDTALGDERIEPRIAQRLTEFRAVLEAEQARLIALEQRVADGTATPADHRALARVYVDRADWETALEYQRGAPAEPADRELLAFLLFKTGRYRDAHGVFAGLARDAGRADLELNDGVTLSLLGDHAGALEAYGRALAIEPDNSLALLYRGNALMRLGRDGDAVVAYKAFLDRGGFGEDEERVRRILEQIAPGAVPVRPPLFPDAPPAPELPVGDEDEEGAGS